MRNDSELTQFVTQLYGSSCYVYAGEIDLVASVVGVIVSACSGLDSIWDKRLLIHD